MGSQESNPAQGRPGFAVLVLCGALLGIAEIVVSAIMRNAGLPYRSAILSGLGMGLMALALALYGRAYAILGVAAVAALCKVMAVPVFQPPFFCNGNAFIAVLLNGSALAGIAAVAGRRMERSVTARAAVGAGAALTGAAFFYALGVYVQPCRPMLSVNVAGGFLGYLVSKGLPAALASGLLLPAGYALGVRLRDMRLPSPGRSGLVGYPVSAAILVSCWLLNGLLVG